MSALWGDKVADLVRSNLNELQDFPQPGVLFRDITPLLANGEAFSEVCTAIAESYSGQVDVVAGLESRGFILAAPIAVQLGIGMLTVRKAGKLPGPVVGVDYDLEYGTARMELRPDSVHEGQRVLIVDDILATGGTAGASVQLLNKCGAHPVAVAVLLELTDLGGRAALEGIPVESAVAF